MKKQYNKLIRDRIPEIIASTGGRCRVETLSEEAYIAKLEEKLSEELGEYLQSRELEELADLQEVIYALAAARGSSVEALEQLRSQKHSKRGGFEKRLLLLEVE